MATRRVNADSVSKSNRPPATTPEGRENQLISLAADLAEKQMADGTASAQVITHFLKLGSTREQLEQERLRHETELLKARVEGAATAKNVEALYSEAMDAFRNYSGREPTPKQEDDYED